MILPGFQSLFSLIAKTYLAQAFYMDAAVYSIVSIWHTEKSDSSEVGRRRAQELSEVAHALNKSAEQRMMTERPRNRVHPPAPTTATKEMEATKEQRALHNTV